MARGSYIFVGIVFTVLGLAFIGSTATIVHEFRHTDWPAMLVTHSHLFLFFPILGILALVAFYIPAVVFTDLYWRYVKFGKIRFLFGFAVLIGISLYFANSLSEKPLRAIWEVSPQTLARDATAPVACTETNEPCLRKAIMPVLEKLRTEAQKRLSTSVFARQCEPDTLLEPPQENAARRMCFPALEPLTAPDCCKAQWQFANHVRNAWLDPAKRSKAADYDRYLLPFKVFFITVLVVIGIFLIVWRKELRLHYSAHLPALDRGILVGAIAMLFWPLMDYAYQQASEVLYGRYTAGIPFRLSLVIVPWAILLVLYFVERLGRGLDRVAQMSTIIASGVAILRYQEINAITGRLLGVGADWWHFVVLGVIALGGLVVLFWPSAPKRPLPAASVNRNMT